MMKEPHHAKSDFLWSCKKRAITNQTSYNYVRNDGPTHCLPRHITGLVPGPRRKQMVPEQIEATVLAHAPKSALWVLRCLWKRSTHVCPVSDSFDLPFCNESRNKPSRKHSIIIMIETHHRKSDLLPWWKNHTIQNPTFYDHVRNTPSQIRL